jgi:hypothetical protein
LVESEGRSGVIRKGDQNEKVIAGPIGNSPRYNNDTVRVYCRALMMGGMTAGSMTGGIMTGIGMEDTDIIVYITTSQSCENKKVGL